MDANEAQARFDLANAQEIAAHAELVVKRGVLEQLIGHPVKQIKPMAPKMMRYQANGIKL